MGSPFCFCFSTIRVIFLLFLLRLWTHSGKILALLYSSTGVAWGPKSYIMQAEQIKALIEQQIPDSQVQVGINGSHIDLVVVSPVFAGLSPVKKQQLVLGTLSQQFADGSIHAVDFIKTFTPQEWQKQQ